MYKMHSATSGRWLAKTSILLGLAGFIVFLTQARLWAADYEATCPANSVVQSISLTEWETGLGAWAVDTYSVANPETFDTPDWAVVGSLPDSRPGLAAFVENLNAGNCGSDDESGVLTLSSPPIGIPLDADGLRIAFNHWFDIEYGWDGGNLKVSVNGGAFTLVPESAFEAGPYTDVLFDAVRDFLPYNTNPLAEQEAFTGPGLQSDGASWDWSSINLAGIAGPGDSIQLRFDFGVDACDGTVGWYVDEVEVYSCVENVAPRITRLTLINQVKNDNGGTADAAAWTLTANGPSGFSGPGPSVSSETDFQAGTYDLSESGPAGYGASDWSCEGGNQIDQNTVTVAEGEDVTCTITFDDLAPLLRLQKTIVNDNGGTIVDPDEFRLTIDGNVVLDDYFYVLNAGVHQASEQGMDGYLAQPWGGDCDPDGSITLALGQTATCTLINDDIAPALRLVKTVLNDDDGTITDPDAFGLRIDGNLVMNDTFYDLEAGDHLASEDGLPGYRPGGWGGDCASDGSITLSVGQQATCTITNDDEGPNIPFNQGLAGAWYNPTTSGQGLLLDVEPEKQFVFLAWFTYTTDDSEFPNEQHWLTAEGFYTGNEAEMVLYESSGGQFDDPSEVTTLPVGSVTLSFSDCINGTLSYAFDDRDLSGSFPITRAIPGSENACQELIGEPAVEAIQINSGMDGAWYDPETSGQGFLIDAYPGGEFMFVAWFTYGDQNASGLRWLTGEGSIVGDQGALTIYNTTGGSFDDGKVPSWEDVGTMNVEFSNCSTATIQYSIPSENLEGTIDVIRAVPGSEILCESLE